MILVAHNSHLKLDCRYNHKVKLDLCDPHSLFVTLLGACGANGDRDHGRLLYAVIHHPGMITSVVTRSPIKPDWGRLPNGYAVDISEHSFPLNFQTGERFRLDMTANATVTSIIDGNRSAVGDDELRRWLDKKGLKHGFSVIELSANRGRSVKIKKHTLSPAHFTAMIEVADPEAIARAYLSGIGREKYAGMGLMRLKRLEGGG